MQFESGGWAGGRGKVDACVVIIDHHAHYATAAQSSAQFTVCTYIQQAVLQHKSSLFCVCVCVCVKNLLLLLLFSGFCSFFCSFFPSAREPDRWWVIKEADGSHSARLVVKKNILEIADRWTAHVRARVRMMIRNHHYGREHR